MFYDIFPDGAMGDFLSSIYQGLSGRLLIVAPLFPGVFFWLPAGSTGLQGPLWLLVASR